MLDLSDYLMKANQDRLPSYYSLNLPYFIATFSAYNKYVNMKNLVQELLFYIISEDEEEFYLNDIENGEPLKNDRIRKLLFDNQFLKCEYVPNKNDFVLKPLKKLLIGTEVYSNFELKSSEFKDYVNSLMLLSMLVMLQDDLNEWINGNVKVFPRTGFFPIRLISGSIKRAITSEQQYYVESEEIIYSIKKLSSKSQKKVLSRIAGIDFLSSSIFKNIPDPEGDRTDLTQEFIPFIKHIAERIRERKNERDDVRYT
jgi:hypothetical protein